MMAASTFNLNFLFLNTYGAHNNVLFIEQSCFANDILFLSETWLKEEQRYVLSSISQDHNVYFKSDMALTPRYGRPYGGRCWYVRKFIEVTQCDFINESVSVLSFKYQGQSFSVIGVYLPFDDKTSFTLNEYESLLSLVREIVLNYKRQGNIVLIGGDFNADVNRGNRFDRLLRVFVDRNNYHLVDQEFSSSLDFTYFKGEGTQNVYRAYIDHCILASKEKIVNYNCQVLYDDVNTSDHNALLLSLSFRGNSMQCSDAQQHLPSTIETIQPNLSDLKIKEDFCRLVDSLIENYPSSHEIASCTNHQLMADTMYSMLTGAMKTAYLRLSKTVIRRPREDKKGSWFTDELHDIKRRILEMRGFVSENATEEAISNLKYWKTKFRRIQRRNTRALEKRKYKEIERLSKEGDKDKFWRKVREAKSETTKDEVTADIDAVAHHFAKVFEAPFEAPDDMHRIADDTCKELDDFTSFPGVEMNPIWLDSALKETRMSRVCGFDGVSSYMLLNFMSGKMRYCLSNFYNFLFKQGVIPTDFNVSVIRPILKDRKKPSDDVSNLRPISISNTMAQIYERILLNMLPQLHHTHRNQFGFKKSTSTTHALFVVKETVTKYAENGTPCHVVSLDAEKAFDKVWRGGLYHKMKEKGVEINVLRILKKYYDTSQGMIKLNGVYSRRFVIRCGVKQGGILSPYLFNFFINDLIEQCVMKNVGAKFDGLNVSIIVYCDDILLISPIKRHLQMLVDICGDFGRKWAIKFNPEKSSVISFGPQSQNVKFYLNNVELKNTESLKYLGIQFNRRMDMNDLAVERFKTVTKSFFSLNSFGVKPGGLNPFLQSLLYKTFCLSKFLYGLEIMTLNMGTLDKMNQTQNAIVRYMTGLSKRSHSAPVLRVLHLFNIRELYVFFKLTFIKNLMKNCICKFIFNYLVNNRTSYKQRTVSFVRDFKTLEQTLHQNLEFIVGNVIPIIKNFKKEAREFDEDDLTLVLVRDCLQNIESFQFIQILNLTLNAIT